MKPCIKEKDFEDTEDSIISGIASLNSHFTACDSCNVSWPWLYYKLFICICNLSGFINCMCATPKFCNMHTAKLVRILQLCIFIGVYTHCN